MESTGGGGGSGSDRDHYMAPNLSLEEKRRKLENHLEELKIRDERRLKGQVQRAQEQQKTEKPANNLKEVPKIQKPRPLSLDKKQEKKKNVKPTGPRATGGGAAGAGIPLNRISKKQRGGDILQGKKKDLERQERLQEKLLREKGAAPATAPIFTVDFDPVPVSSKSEPQKPSKPSTSALNPVKSENRICPLCPVIMDKNEIRDHLLSVHKEVLLECPSCSKEYRWKSPFKKHAKKNHPEELDMIKKSVEFQIKERYGAWITEVEAIAKIPQKKEIILFQNQSK